MSVFGGKFQVNLVLIVHEALGGSQVSTLAYFHLKEVQVADKWGISLHRLESLILCSHIQVISSLKIGFVYSVSVMQMIFFLSGTSTKIFNVFNY